MAKYTICIQLLFSAIGFCGGGVVASWWATFSLFPSSVSWSSIHAIELPIESVLTALTSILPNPFLDCLWLALSLLEIGIQGHCPHNQQKRSTNDSLNMGNWILMFTPFKSEIYRGFGCNFEDPNNQQNDARDYFSFRSLWWRGVTHSTMMIGCFHLHHQISHWANRIFHHHSDPFLDCLWVVGEVTNHLWVQE